MIYSCVTDRGRKRPVNEDACYVCKPDDNSCVAVVCDGMGGENAGEVASGLAVKIISERINNGWRKDMPFSSVRALFESAISAANAVIGSEAEKNISCKGMGTTVVAAAVIGSEAVIAHAGDSRCYVFDGKLRRVTKDHSFVQELVDAGRLSEEEAAGHPKRNYITRALGINDTIDVDYDILTLQPGELLLLCSDGLYNFVGNDEAEEILRSFPIKNAAERLAAAANKNGGGDNITAVVISPAQGE